METIAGFLREQFGLTQALSPVYLLCTVLIVALVYLLRKEKGSFVAFLLPREIWTNSSVGIDIWLLILNRMIALLGLSARFAAAPAVAAWIASTLPWTVWDGAGMSPLALALLVFVISDFALYFIHRAYHTIGTIWPLHAVHHSAAVLTPLTAYRLHPLAIILNTAMMTLIFGGLFGVLAGTFSPDLTLAEIAGANAFVVLANLTVTNLHHSHVWISFGPVIERFLISPAQHQIHHSVAPRHFNKNFGQTLAVWDWLFGSLYVIRDREEIVFGLNEEAEAPLMTQRIDLVLIDPVRRLFVSAR